MVDEESSINDPPTPKKRRIRRTFIPTSERPKKMLRMAKFIERKAAEQAGSSQVIKESET